LNTNNLDEHGVNAGTARLALACFVATAFLQVALTYFALEPRVGFDDANITQVYARNLAGGFGYVYNIGSERVEGSTSLLWTLINAAMFLTPYPILMLTCLSFLLTLGTMALSGGIARALGASQTTVAIVYLLFNLFPGFFAWSLWSLMDITFWVFAITAMFWSILRVEAGDTRLHVKVVLLTTALCLPLARPEGIVVVIGLAMLLAIARRNSDQSLRIALWIGGLGLASLTAATIWRLSYFGYPVPNTFYAKTSTDFAGQIEQGLKYVANFLREPTTVLLMLGIGLGLGGLVTRDWARAASRIYILLVSCFAVGALLVYSSLGGDHFGSYRFLIFLYPIGLPLVAIALAEFWTKTRDRVSAGILLGTLLTYAILTLGVFAREGGGIRHELGIAEDGRALGRALAELPGPPSLAVITAGGIKMAYPGLVYDVLGLNWTTMAHAGTVSTNALKNHGGFNAEVFMQARAQLAFPRWGSCADGQGDVLDGFKREVTGNIATTRAFRDRYIAMCNDQFVLYVDRSMNSLMQENGFLPYSETFSTAPSPSFRSI
jgi:arabinofuranosyltransferase